MSTFLTDAGINTSPDVTASPPPPPPMPTYGATPAKSMWKMYVAGAVAAVIGWYVTKNKGWKMSLGVALISAVVVTLLTHFALGW